MIQRSIAFKLAVVVYALSLGNSYCFNENEMGIIANKIQGHLNNNWLVSVEVPDLAIRITDRNDVSIVLIELKFLSMDKEVYLAEFEKKAALWVDLFRGFKYKEDFARVRAQFDRIDLPDYHYYGTFVNVVFQEDGGSEVIDERNKLMSRLDSFFVVLPKFEGGE